jgi:hypothetical protein
LLGAREGGLHPVLLGLFFHLGLGFWLRTTPLPLGWGGTSRN